MDATRDNKESGVWRTRVTDLVFIFREALQVLAPVVRKAQINYEDDLAYDDWDNIAQNLYSNIVERSVRFATGLDGDLSLPSYAMLYETYEQNALGAALPEGRLVVPEGRMLGWQGMEVRDVDEGAASG